MRPFAIAVLLALSTASPLAADSPADRPPRAAATPVPGPPTRRITRGPRYHWFGYYDKLQFDPTGRYVLSGEVDFEHRSPRAEDEIRVGMVDTERGDRWIVLGSSHAWCWQQGCMLQWRPGSDREVLWNDREGGRFVSRILDVRSGERRTIPWPIYTLSPDGRWALSADFRRIDDMRPGYGYPGLPDPRADDSAPEDSGIRLVDLESGEGKLIVSLAQVAARPSRQPTEGAKHYFNHLLFSPDGTRFVFLHRWRVPGRRGFLTCMISAARGGGKLRVIDDNGWMSHFIWRDPGHLLGWASLPERGSGFYLFPDGDGEVVPVGRGVMTVNGHCSYLPGGEWILNDTYPRGPRREQEVYLFHVRTGKKVVLGSFPSPGEYTGEWRCDTHPRFSPDGRKVCIDAPDGDRGRQLWLIDIGAIVDSPPPQ